MTYAPKSEFLHTVIARGLLQDCTDLEGLDEALLAGEVPGYIGFDCTADSLHVGHLTGIMLLRWLQKTGHKPIALMGGGTTRIGDPSGKDEARQLLTDEIINANMAGIRTVFSSYLDFEETGGNAIQPNNAEWLNALNYIDFLRDYGRHFTINRMLSFDSVKLRLDREQGEIPLALPLIDQFVKINNQFVKRRSGLFDGVIEPRPGTGAKRHELFDRLPILSPMSLRDAQHFTDNHGG